MEIPENKHVFINDVVQSQLDSEAVESMVQVAVTNVLVIYTGGTIGMKHTAEHGYVPVERFLSNTLRKSNRFFDPMYKMQKHINTVCATLHRDDGVKSSTTIELPALVTPSSLYNKRIRYSVLEYTPLLDSCNITMNDWVKIASDIEANYESFDAFLVLHGTDTMAYTASALSFMLQNLGKSVIITGSQVPLAELRTDAVENLLGSLTIAGHFVIPEVGLFFDNKLYRGNRCSKMNGVEFNAFDSPNIHPLVNLGVNIDVNWDEIWSPSKIARFSVHKELNPNVASLRLFPGITAATVKAFFYPGIQGVVLETFGAGNAPSNRPDILQILQDACTEGIVIVNCSQCKKASVVAMYQTGSALEKIGVIPGADMTPECALTKLAYLLSKYPNNPKKVRTLIAKNIRGELTETSQKPRFSYITSGYPLNTFLSSILGLIGHRVGADPSSGTIETAPEIEIDDINNASDHPESKKLSHLLVPLAFCHSAREGDIPILSYLCSEFPSMINLYSYDGMTPLHVAAIEGKANSVRFLLKKGAMIHLKSKFNRSPLLDSVLFYHEEIVQILLQAGAHFGPKEDREIASYLCKAIFKRDIAQLKLFLDAGANPNLSFQDQRTPLHLVYNTNEAVSLNELEIVKFLLDYKNPSIDPFIGDETGDAQEGSSTSSVVDLPLEISYELDLEPKDFWGKTPIMYAEDGRFEDVVSALKSAINSKKLSKMTH